MALVDVVLAALAVVHPGGTPETRAAAVTAIVDASREAPLWAPATSSDDAPEIAATALLLAAIAEHESSFDPRVGDCRVRGRGNALGYFQLMGRFALDGHAPAEICASTDLGARLALRVLRTHRCKACPPARWLNGYASGHPGFSSKASRDTRAIWVKLATAAGLQVFPLATTAPRWVSK